MKIALATPVSAIARVGQVAAKQLKRLGIETVEDLIFYFPFRYEDLRQLKPIAEIEKDELVTIRGVIKKLTQRKSPRRRLVLIEAVVADESGELKVIWFNQPYIVKTLAVGDTVNLAGKVKKTLYGQQMSSPVFEKISSFTERQGPMHTNRLVPIYPTTAGLTQKQLRFLQKIVQPLTKGINDWLPKDVVKRQKLYDLRQAVNALHFPKEEFEIGLAIKRLKFEEIFIHQLITQKTKQLWSQRRATALTRQDEVIKKFVASLPFKLTQDQRLVIHQTLNDLTLTRPMNRLVEGDVGSGKTIVAAAALLNAALNKQQGALLAPTEILAHQHYQTFLALFKNQPIKVSLLTGGWQSIDDQPTDKKTLRRALEAGYADIVIGTHALLSQGVNWQSLGLVVVDEQHRFGVEQRQLLLNKGGDGLVPHFLSLTATPIPRTLSLTLYGGLELSLLRQKPVGRKPIITKLALIRPRRDYGGQVSALTSVYERVRHELNQGRQAYFLCPLIDPSDTAGVASVKEESEKLKKIFAEFKIAALHGQLSSKAKEEVMTKFVGGEIDLLVTTSVIEVGVNVPNATIIVILGAERFGLAQLHQFRGRVGRADYQSYCFLVAANGRPETMARLKLLETCDDGFALAEKDLAWRGAGDLYGERQSGLPNFRFASFGDVNFFKAARTEAENLLAADPALNNEPLLKAKIEEQIKKVHHE